MKKNKFVYVLRVNKKEGNIEILHVDEWLNLVCWAEIGEHCEVSRAYYLNDTQPIPNERQEEANYLFERYMSSYPTSDDIIEVRGKRLQAPTYNLVFDSPKNNAFYLSTTDEYKNTFVILKRDKTPLRSWASADVTLYKSEDDAKKSYRPNDGEKIVMCSDLTDIEVINDVLKSMKR